MGKSYKQPQKREVMAGSKLEIEMLQYSLNEANQKLAKKSADLDNVTRIMEQTTKVAAIIEAGIIIGQILLKVVA